jgi:hypothetical protein
LGMALLVLQGKTKGCCKGSSSRANPLGMALLPKGPWFSPAPQQGKLKPKALCSSSRANPLYSPPPKGVGKSQPFGYGSASFPAAAKGINKATKQSAAFLTKR